MSKKRFGNCFDLTVVIRYATKCLGHGIRREVRELVTPTVLIAENEADLREYLADLFRARGCRVVVASDGQGALACVAGHEIHFAVIDMLLPGESGFRVLSEYKARTNGLGRAAMISANGSADHQHYAKAIGADHFFVKPFAVEDLLRSADPHITVGPEPPAAIEP